MRAAATDRGVVGARVLCTSQPVGMVDGTSSPFGVSFLFSSAFLLPLPDQRTSGCP
jgi:hypothetical protein